MHDHVSAWFGLGSALLSWHNQTRLVSQAVMRVILITLYLLGIFAYHNVAPTLFDLAIYDSIVDVTTRLHQPESIM